MGVVVKYQNNFLGGLLGIVGVDKLALWWYKRWMQGQELDNPTAHFLSPTFREYDRFDQPKKQLFLENFAKNPNISGVANALGHSKQVIFWHLERDPEFKQRFEEVKEGITDAMEARVAEYGQRPQNFMDRIAWLRARRPEVWNPERNVNVNIQDNTVVGALQRATVYEAEIVAAPAIPSTEIPTTDGASTTVNHLPPPQVNETK